MNRNLCIWILLLTISSAYGMEFRIANRFGGAIRASVLYSPDDGATWIATPFQTVNNGQRVVLARSNHDTVYFFAQAIGENTMGVYWGRGDVWSPVDGSIMAYPMTRIVGDDGETSRAEFIVDADNATRNGTAFYAPAFWNSTMEDAILYEAVAGNVTYELRSRFLIFRSGNPACLGAERTFWVYEFRSGALKSVTYFSQFRSEDDLCSSYRRLEELMGSLYAFDVAETEDGTSWNSRDARAMIHAFPKDRWMITTFRDRDCIGVEPDALEDLDLESYLAD